MNLETRLASLEVNTTCMSPTPNSSNVRPEPEAAKSVSPEPDGADTKLQSTSMGEEHHLSNTPTCEIINNICCSNITINTALKATVIASVELL